MEFAPAKINLTLHVTGQRGDGYHLLDSLVVFANIGDRVSVTEASALSLVLSGAEAQGLAAESDNLVLRAARLFGSRGATLQLEKNLPTSSGIGGGSADAAAALRALAKHWDCPLPKAADVLSLGADVPVCLASKTCRMSGIGDVLRMVPALPEMHLVLVNPRQAISTPSVFKALKERNNFEMDAVSDGLDYERFCTWLKTQRNDLQAPAMALTPVISEVLSAIEKTGANVTRMSGSGATCFGIYGSFEQAQKAAARLTGAHADWWVKPASVL